MSEREQARGVDDGGEKLGMKDFVPYGSLILHADFSTLPVFFLFTFSLSLSH